MTPIEPLGHPTTALATATMPDQLIDVDALAAAFGSLPVEGLVPAAVAVAMGGLLWWFGERLLRLAMMVVADLEMRAWVLWCVCHRDLSHG